MATEEVRRQFRARGIRPISDTEGCRFFVDEIRHGRRGEVEVVAGEGPWSPSPGEPVEAAQSAQSERAAAPMVLLRRKPRVQANGAVVLEHRIGLNREAFLEDHRLDQRPVLPAAGALELIAEFAQAAWPELSVSEVRSLSVLKGITLEPGAERALVLSARSSSHGDADGVQVVAEILDPKTRTPFYRGFVILRPQLEPAPESKFDRSAGPGGMDASDAYQQLLFHGPRFHLIDRIERLDERGAVALVAPARPPSG